MSVLASMRRLGWFRYRKIGFGVSPRSPMGWTLTVGLLAGIWVFRYFVRQGSEPLPPWFYVTCAVAIAIYTVVAFLTAVRED